MNEPLDYEWAMGLAKVMLTNDHPRGVLNLVRCFQDAEERAHTSELAELAPLRPSECQRFVDERLTDVRECAKKFGYAMALHGSLARDVDLVAVPWVAEVKPADALVAAIMDTIRRCDFCNGEQPEDNPHGRRSWSIWMHEYSTYLDVSVTPCNARGGKTDAG